MNFLFIVITFPFNVKYKRIECPNFSNFHTLPLSVMLNKQRTTLNKCTNEKPRKNKKELLRHNETSLQIASIYLAGLGTQTDSPSV